jgi:hypothetical protein
MVTFWENDSMNNLTLPDLLDDPATEEADHKAVWECAANGTKLDPEIAARVRARSDRAREATFQRVGYVNIQEFLRPSTDDDNSKGPKEIFVCPGFRLVSLDE